MTSMTTARTLAWVQIVTSKSGGEPHSVRGFSDGVTTCDCLGYKHYGYCRHQGIGKAQEAREAAAQAALFADGEFSGEVSIPAEDVFVFEPTPFDDEPAGVNWNSRAVAAQPKRTAEQARQDWRDLTGEEYRATGEAA